MLKLKLISCWVGIGFCALGGLTAMVLGMVKSAPFMWKALLAGGYEFIVFICANLCGLSLLQWRENIINRYRRIRRKS